MISFVKIDIGEAEKKAVMEVLDSGMLAQGSRTAAFESAFANYCGAQYAIATTSGTSALHTALYAMGIRAGDEVITTPFTFVATANAAVMQGARPVFADILPDTFNIDPDDIARKITPKTKAIIPVNLFGQPYDVEAINSLAAQYGLLVLEDAAQSVGAMYRDKKSGTFGNCAAFSFYATKNIITGEGGMITTDSPEMAELCKRFRHHGQSEQTRYQYYELGYNYRMTDLQAAIGLVQLSKADTINARRAANAQVLTQGLKHIEGLEVPKVVEGCSHVFHQYTIKVNADKRDLILNRIKENGVACGVYYPKSLHLHPHFLAYGYKEGDFPVSEQCSGQVIALPVHPQLTDDELKTIVEVVSEAVTFYQS